MSLRHVLGAVLALAMLCAPGPARASCGAEDCPMEMRGAGAMGGRFGFDVAYQYVLQDRVLVGSRRGSVGELPSPEDEVATVSRTVNLLGRANLTERFGVTAALPIVDRTHIHISNEAPPIPEVMEWHYHGVGDLTLLGQASVTRHSEGGTAVSFQFGAKFPTGRRHVVPEGEEEPEPAARPGTGSFDVLAGIHVMRSFHVATAGGAAGTMPLFVSLMARANGRGTDEYRVGNELQATVGAVYPVGTDFEVSLQLNGRLRGMDDVGLSDALRENTGGQSLFVSPGVRVHPSRDVSLYGTAQIPVYQHVNRIQIVAPYHLLFGTTFELGR